MQGLSLATDQNPLTPGNVVLRGVPKALADRVSEVILEITPDDRLSRIQIDEVDGSITEYRFTDHSENIPVADQQFKFKAPPGVELIEGDFGQ